MKRFLLIFVICFGIVVGTIGAVFGVKYIKGDFNEVVVNPENISFEFDEYDVIGDFNVTITTTTEGVTANTVYLSFAKGTVTKPHGVNHWTDDVVIIPRQVQIGVPFEIKLAKTSDEETDNLQWIKGGISNIVATSECVTTPKDETSVYVDVPVYKTELVVLNGDGQIETSDSYVNALTYIEGQTGLVKDAEESLNAGDTFYVGLKYYPARSAYRYSKASSSNLLVEYHDEILAKIEELGLTETYSEKFDSLTQIFAGNDATKQISIQDIINSYSSIINLEEETNTTKIGQLTSYLKQLNEEFESNLKYFTFEETANNEQTYLTKLNRVGGTNLFKVQATTDSVLLQSGVTASLYSYSFANAKIETDTLDSVGSNYNNLLSALENLNAEQGELIADKKVDKQTLAFGIVDVDVDSITFTGELQDFSINKIHTIYLAQEGEGSGTTSYLGIKLNNSNVQTVDLQSKMANVGIRFEKRVSTNTWSHAEEIMFVDSQNYSTLTYDGATYYLPLGNSVGYYNTYWQIYADDYISNDIRAVLVYFKGDLSGEIVAGQLVSAIDLPMFKLDDPSQTEAMVKWTDTTALTLGVVDISGTVDMSVTTEVEGAETLKDVSYNKEIDLSKYVDIPQSNYYQTYKFFLYSDETDAESLAPISSFFYTTEDTPKQYPFYGATKNLYELDGNILKLKSTEWPTTYTVKVIFATIKTGALRAPILTPIYDVDGETILDYRYTFVKYSAVKENIVENISPIAINFTGSIKTLSGAVSTVLRADSINENVAGKAVDGLFKVAQGANNALVVTVACEESDGALVKSAIDSGDLRIEALESKTGAINYISYTTEYVAGINYFIISTLGDLTQDVAVRLYLVYNVDGEEYLFPVTISYDGGTYHKLTIVKNTSASATFNFLTTVGVSVVDADEIDYISVVTDYAKNPDGSNDTTNFEKSYYVYYLDPEKNVDDMSKRKISISDSTTNKVLVEVIDFLGNVTTKITDWYLTTSNQTVATIQENQIINFIGSCSVDSPLTISLYLASGVLQQSVDFVVENSGMASRVVANPDTINESVIYDETVDVGVTYNFAKQTVAVTETAGTEIQIDDLLRIFYKLNKDATAYKLPMLVYIANESSLNALKAISSATDAVQNFTLNADDDTYYEKNNIEQIKLSKNLGSVVSVDLLFKCSALGITQAVTLKFNQTISISNVSITNVSTGTEVVMGSSVYQIYAGIDYHVALTSDSSTFYWYLDGATEESQIYQITDKSFDILFQDGSLAQQKIHITAIKAFPATGDLNYILEFKVQKNVALKTLNQITKPLVGNTLTIPLTDLFERISATSIDNGGVIEYFNNLAQYAILGNITFEYGVNYSSDNAKIKSIATLATYDAKVAEDRDLTIQFNEFSDELNIVIYIKCNGEILGERISIKVIPENLQNSTKNVFAYYNGEKAIIVSNGLTVKTATTNWFEDLFTDGVVVCDDGFYATYTTTESGNTKVVLSVNTLFENTEKKVTVTKDGITASYLVVISKLAFPFVEFVDYNDNDISYADLDVYKLFVDTVNILQYYQTANIKSFTAQVEEGESEAKLLLASTENDADAVFKLKPFGAASTIYNAINFNSTISTIEVLQGSLLASSYATVSHTSTDGTNGSAYLNVNPVGEDVYLKVTLNILPNGSSTYYEIPVVVKLEVTQTLRVTYPFAGVYKDSSDDEYGSDLYDNEFMITNASTFEDAYKYMEYLSFDVNGLATLKLVDSNYNRFSVYKGATLDSTYEGSYKFEIIKIAKNTNGVWTFVDSNKLVNYAHFEDGTLLATNGILTISNTFSDGGVLSSAFRIKLKVTTMGGAVSYYYVSVGEQVPLTLMRQKGSTNVSVGTTDSISISASKHILIGSANGEGYSYDDVNPEVYYYISNTAYNKELKFRLFDSNKNIIPDDQVEKYVTVDKNKLTIAVQPMGVNFVLQIYTSYGVLSTINVTVEPSISINLTSSTIYSGASYSYADIISITNGAGVGTVSFVNVESATTSIYFSCEDGSINFIDIPAGESKVFDMHLRIYVKIDGKDFDFEHTFSSVTLTPRVVAKVFGDGFYRDETSSQLTTYTEDSGMIELSNQIWKNMFIDLKAGTDLAVENESNLDFYIDGVKVTENVTSSTITWTIANVLTDDDVRNWTFTIKSKKTDEVIASAYAKITIKPQYDIVLKYPTVVDMVGDSVVGLTAEYVQNGSSITFSAPNFSNTEARISVFKSNSGTYDIFDGFDIVYEGADGVYGSKVTGDKSSGFTFNFEASDFSNKTEIECKFNVLIGDGVNAKTYATYIVKVLKDSPFTLDADYLDTIYYGYGSEDAELFKTVDVIVTLPTIATFATGQKIDLYTMVNDTKTNIATEVYYKAGDKIHGLLNVIAYSTDLKVYICEAGAGAPDTDMSCDSVEFNVRATLKYHGYQVQYKDYANIMGDAESAEIANLNNVQTYSVSVAKNSSLSIVSSEYVVSGVYVDFTFDINIDDDYATKETALVLNANQNEYGQSFVNLFNVTDSLGNMFWYNQLGGTRNTSLLVNDIDGAIECLPVYPQTIEETTYKYDYLLKPLGAKNNGTYCELTFTYTFESLVYTKVLFVKVVSDIEFEIYNNDGTTTPNSSTNPLKIDAGSEDISFVSLAQTKYIYAYSKYSSEKPNVAQLFTYTVQKLTESATDFITVKKLSNPTALMLDITPGASFGNKTIELVLKDMYGFEIHYYIELIADINVTSITTVAGKVFEGDSISVYNKNVAGASGTSGSVALTLNNGVDKDTVTEIEILQATFWFNGSTKYSANVINGIIENNTKVSFNFLSYADIWDTTKGLTNGASFVGTLNFVIVKADPLIPIASREKYSFEVGFTLYKKYSFGLLAENTFVREDVDIDLTHFVDVYDYKQENYLGKPVLSKNEEIKASLYLNQSGDTKQAGTTTDLLSNENTLLYTYITSQLATINAATSKDSVELAWQNLAGWGIQEDSSNQGAPVVANDSAYDTGLYLSYLIKQDNELYTYADNDQNGTYELTKVSEIVKEADEEYVYVKDQRGQKIYTRTYNVDNLGMFLRIRATHKTNGSTVERESYQLINKTDAGVYYIEYREPLGNDSSTFGANVTTQDYYFDIYLCSIGETIQNKKKIATTKESEQGSANAVANQILTPITSGSLYTVEITNSQKLVDNVNLAFCLNENTDVVYVINNYRTLGQDASISPITAGYNVFNLYDGEYQNAKKFTKQATDWTEESINEITFEGQTISLFTGKIRTTEYVNGLSTADSQKAKNILSASYMEEGETVEGLTYKGSLSGNVFSYDDDYGIYYQTRTISSVNVLYYEYGSVDAPVQANAFEAKDLLVNVTLKYTGVDTDNAYVGSTMHYVYVKGLIVNETTGELDSDLNINFAPSGSDPYWAEGFALKTGVGVANVLAGFENKEFIGSNKVDGIEDPVENRLSLAFEAGEVKGATTTSAASLFAVDATTGNVTLKQGFIPNSYYISVIIKARYNGTDTRAIGTVYLSFVAVDDIDIYNIGSKQWKLNITDYVGTQAEEDITLEAVKLEGAITQYVYKDGTDWYAIFDNSNESIKTGRSLLSVGTVSKYVYLNVHEIALKNNATVLNIYKINSSTYAINGNDLLVTQEGVLTKLAGSGFSGILTLNTVPSDAMQVPNTIVSGNFVENSYFAFSTLDNLATGISITNNSTYYIGLDGSYCKVTVKIQNMFADELILDGTEIDITGKNIYLADGSESDMFTFLDSECTDAKLDGHSIALYNDGTNRYITNYTYELSSQWVELTFVDKDEVGQTLLIKVVKEA